MKKAFFFLLTVSALSISINCYANKSVFGYQHDYFTQNRVHTDTLDFNYYIGNSLMVGVGVDLFNKSQDVFDNPSLHSTRLKTTYSYSITPEWNITPAMEFMFYAGTNPNSENIPSKSDWTGEIGDTGTSGVKYKPSIMLTYKPVNTLGISAKYEYNLRKLARYYRNTTKYGGSDLRTHIVGIDLNYQPNKYLTFNYEIRYLDANYIVYNNKKQNYDQKLKVMYRINRDWQPYISIKDTAAKTDTSMREEVVGAGFLYYF
ncbi:oligogalacturonate-specific porin KdgM family protein [Brenneria uluponensis]|uniref:oligogalacturonate-specific porin KdgM family protein n=1 Tax=Brenneria uluponensis TaxID=3057057 RepID=UPI0028EB133D|nr:oligogalacturonate-specific porin KdgM family protein [Brenneria ulupoensis]